MLSLPRPGNDTLSRSCLPFRQQQAASLMTREPFGFASGAPSWAPRLLRGTPDTRPKRPAGNQNTIDSAGTGLESARLKAFTVPGVRRKFAVGKLKTEFHHHDVGGALGSTYSTS